MQFTYTGNNTRFLEQSFFDQTGALQVELTSITPVEAVLTHTVFTQANVNVVLRGIGFVADQNGIFLSGQITSMEFSGLNVQQGLITGINWSAEAFQNALFDIANTSDFTGLAQLFNASSRITIDASNGLGGFDQELAWEPFLPLITKPITFVGSPFDDAIQGGPGDDIILPGASSDDGDRIVGSGGDDILDFALPQGSTTGPGFILDYDTIANPVTFDIDGVTNTGSVTSAGFTDTLRNVNDALGQYLGLEGTNGADTYTVRIADDQVISLIGGSGADTYSIDTVDGLPILDFLFGDVTSGIDIDFDTGVIANDGFGFAETVDFVETPTITVLFATDLADTATNGPGTQLIRFYDGDDLFVSDTPGNDSVDGGNGTDTARFDALSQGDTTLVFQGAVTTVTDRANPGASTALLGVERLQTAGGVQLELDKHDGIGLISAADLTTLTELYIAYFDRAADALGLSFWATAFQKNGFSFEQIADQFFTQPETVALYSGVSDGDFVTAVYNNVLGRNPDQAGFDFWTGQLAAGTVTESGFILDLLAGARAATGSPADVAFIEGKTDIGLYFAVIQGQNNLTAANDVMDAFTGSPGSLVIAQNLSDAALADAQAGSADLLMPVIGVVDTPFADIA